MLGCQVRIYFHSTGNLSLTVPYKAFGAPSFIIFNSVVLLFFLFLYALSPISVVRLTNSLSLVLLQNSVFRQPRLLKSVLKLCGPELLASCN